MPSFTCPCCGIVSYNPSDVEHGFCARCHAFTGGTPEERAAHAGAECEWRQQHEVAACYDNMRGVAVGTEHGSPTLECSCGVRAQGDTWEEAGAGYDEHVAAFRGGQ